MASLLLQGFGWAALAGGMITLAIGVTFKQRAKQQSRWISVPGLVATSEVKFDGELFTPLVTYSYTVSGQQFTGDVVRSGLVCFNWRGPAERMCERYAAGTTVRVYVDESDPSAAVLEPGGDRAFRPFMFAVAAVLFVIGLVVLVP